MPYFWIETAACPSIQIHHGSGRHNHLSAGKETIESFPPVRGLILKYTDTLFLTNEQKENDINQLNSRSNIPQ